MFEKKIYIRRRNLLKKRLGSGLVLFLGNGESPMNYRANVYPFRQDSSFLYFFGLDSPELAAVIDIDENREILFGNDVGIEDIIWVGPQPKLKDRAAQVGVKETLAFGKLDDIVKAALEKRRPVHFLPPYRADISEKIGELTGAPAREVRSKSSEDLIKAVVEQRSVKSDQEIGEIEEALEITYPMYMAAMEMARAGRFEREVTGAMEGIMRSLGGAFAFPPIVTINGHIFHNTFSGNALKKGRMLVADCGAESSLHYACDITRSIPVGGRFNRRQRDIYEIVLEAQLTAIAAMKPGIRFRDIHLKAARTIAGGLKDLGLMKGDLDAAVEKGAHALFFPHGLGHQLGLDVHDMENLGETHVGYDANIKRSEQFGLAYLRMARELRPGHVMTVEPGVYFIPALVDEWRKNKKHTDFINYDKVETFLDFGGIRIEDDVLVVDKGRRVLGRPIPKTVEAVENAAS